MVLEPFGEMDDEREVLVLDEPGEFLAAPGVLDDDGRDQLDAVLVDPRTDNCGEVEVYLRRDGTYYRVALVNGDHIIAHSDGEEY